MDESQTTPETEIFIEELKEILSKDQAFVIKCVLDDPRFIKPSGKVNINAIALKMGKTWNEVSQLINEVGIKIGNDL